MKSSDATEWVASNDSVCLTVYDKAKRLFHWAPFVALFIIFFITATGTNALSHIMHPLSSVFNFFHFLFYVYEFYLIMSNYITASFLGPGFVDLEWRPKNDADREHMQYCELCEGFKPPRAHHCRKCDRCVMKMDHHCPWINTCCGHLNHGFFVYFLFFAPIGCIHSTFILSSTIYHAIYLEYFISTDGPIVILSLIEFLCTFFAAGLAVGVVIAVGSLWIIQMKSILKNETGVESWIKEKAIMRQRESEDDVFVYPYDLGRCANLRSVMTWSGRCCGDGIRWPVPDGSGQYDLTMEQIKQKKDKSNHSQLFEVKKPFNGALLPMLSFGCRVTYGSPCTDEYRLPVCPGQLIKVTRWRKHWLYGQIVYPKDANLSMPARHRAKKGKPRGWFPSMCARLYKNGACGDTEYCIDNHNVGKNTVPTGNVNHRKNQ